MYPFLHYLYGVGMRLSQTMRDKFMRMGMSATQKTHGMNSVWERSLLPLGKMHEIPTRKT